jgi:hypothetical protein
VGTGDRWDQETSGIKGQVGSCETGGIRRQVRSGDRWDQEAGGIRRQVRSGDR